jgi:hypothetical protein
LSSTSLNASLTPQTSFWSCYLHFYAFILGYNPFLNLVTYISERLFYAISQFPIHTFTRLSQASSWPCYPHFHASILRYNLFFNFAIHTSNASLTPQASFWPCYLYFYVSILCYNLFLNLITHTSERLSYATSQFPIHTFTRLSHVIICFLTLPPTPLSPLSRQKPVLDLVIHTSTRLSYIIIRFLTLPPPSKCLSHATSQFLTLLSTPQSASLTPQPVSYPHFHAFILRYNLFLNLATHIFKCLSHVTSQFLTLLFILSRVHLIL